MKYKIVTKLIFLFVFTCLFACGSSADLATIESAVEPATSMPVMPMAMPEPEAEACLGETCMCSTEDCIDVNPDHECDSTEEGCEDSSLDLDIEPCTPGAETCDAPFDSEAEGEDDLDPTGDGQSDNDLSIPELNILVQVKIGKRLVDRIEPVIDQKAREEVVRRGGYLAALRHDNINNIAIPALQQRYERLARLLGTLDTVLDATDGHLKIEVIYYH